MEERVRDAFGAAAETVTAQDLPGPPAPAGRARAARGLRAWAGWVRLHALVPVAAAVSVAVIIVTATVVVPRLLAGPAGGQAGALAGAPKFFAGVAEGRTVVNIYRSATGRVAAFVRPPGHLRVFRAVSRLGSDRAYVVAAATNNGCTTRLYRFTIDSRGRPSGLTPLSVPQVTGVVGELAGSAGGTVLAYTASGPCLPHGPRAHWRAGVIRLATGQVTTWTYPMETGRRSTSLGSLSLTADGSMLGLDAGPDGRIAGVEDAWALPTSSPGGPLTRHARKVLHLRNGVFRVLLSSTGAQAYVETSSSARGAPVLLDLYSTTTGQRIRPLGRIGPGGRNFSQLSISLDAAGRHLLAYGYISLSRVTDPNLPASEREVSSSRVTEMNLTTGQTASTTAPHLVTEGALSTAAW